MLSLQQIAMLNAHNNMRGIRYCQKLDRQAQTVLEGTSMQLKRIDAHVKGSGRLLDNIQIGKRSTGIDNLRKSTVKIGSERTLKAEMENGTFYWIYGVDLHAFVLVIKQRVVVWVVSIGLGKRL